MLKLTSGLVAIPLAVAATAAAPIYSSLESPQQRRAYLETISPADVKPGHELTIAEQREQFDAAMMPGLERLRAQFPVRIHKQSIGGVDVYVVTPRFGVSSKNRQRVLVNLHGGGFSVGADYLAQIESIPVAVVGGYKVVSVQYRLGPENHFPAASEDVAKVYAELLRHYRSQEIGIFGCSAGGVLTTEAVAWFQHKNLPQPAAIGIFGAGGLLGPVGVSSDEKPGLSEATIKKQMPYLDTPGLDLKDPLVSPASSQATLPPLSSSRALAIPTCPLPSIRTRLS
jgi:acetyl esterase/lipase